MSSRRTAAFLTLMVYLWSMTRGAERSVTCILGSSCSLPCPFDPGPEVLIHWLHPPEDTARNVHSYYYDEDQLKLQKDQYKYRTQLFKDQINKGNATLQITGVRLNDSGRYKCYTSTIKGNNEDFVTMNVQAPVSSVSLSLSEDEQKLTCSSQNIYPQPLMEWIPEFESKPNITSLDSGLWSILSSVSLSQNLTFTYSCNVSTKYSWKSATYRRHEPVMFSDSVISVSCPHSHSDVKWTFNRNDLNLNETKWKNRAEIQNGNLLLKDLTADHQGLYSCLLNTENEHFVTVTKVTVNQKQEQEIKVLWFILGSVLALLGLIALCVGVICYCRRKNKKNETERESPAENGADMPLCANGTSG